MKKILIITASMFLMILYAEAQNMDGNYGINKRQQIQRARIAQGIDRGDLNRAKATGLLSQQHRIRRSERMARADGIVTRGERQRLNRKQNMANRNIRQAKKNCMRRNSY